MAKPLSETLSEIAQNLTPQNTQESEKQSSYSEYYEHALRYTTPEILESIMDGPRVKLDAEDLREIMARCESFKKTDERKSEFMAEAGVPPLFMSATKEDFPKKVWTKVMEHPSSFISGKPGTGKTHLAAAVIRSIYEDAVPKPYFDVDVSRWRFRKIKLPAFTTIPGLLLRMRASISDENKENELGIIEEYTEDRLVVFDDFGAEKMSEWSLQVLYIVIDHRYTRMLPTIITSNLTIDDIGGRISDRLASRIAGMCNIINLVGEDRRLRKRTP